MSPDILEFLEQSNRIEGVYDAPSLEDAVEAWKFCIAQPKLTEAVVRETHKILMRRQNISEYDKGKYRVTTVYIGGKAAIDPVHISGALQTWLRKMKRLPANWEKMHVEYEKIHPFIDGNGRFAAPFDAAQIVIAAEPANGSYHVSISRGT